MSLAFLLVTRQKHAINFAFKLAFDFSVINGDSKISSVNNSIATLIRGTGSSTRLGDLLLYIHDLCNCNLHSHIL